MKKFKYVFIVFFPLLFTLSAYAGPEYDALMDAIHESHPGSNPRGVLEMLSAMSEDLNQKRTDGWSALLLSAAKGNPVIVRALTENGADLSQTVEFQGKKATAFILAAQYGREEVMAVLLKSAQFTGAHLNEEIRNAYIFVQVALAVQLMSLSDPMALSYQQRSVNCPVCLGLPGVDETLPAKQKLDRRRIDGSILLGDSAITTCCYQFFCKSCLERTIQYRMPCPTCRAPLTAQRHSVIRNLCPPLPKFQWLEAHEGGSQKFPLPDESMDQSQGGGGAVVAMDQEGDGVMARFRAQFVQVPPGMLPDGTQIAAMEADRYPVTREFWNEIMGGMPEHVPAANRVTWNDAPRVPVTFVSWENQNGSPAEVQGFLARLNEREQATGCVYDLPTDQQLWYLIRGDVTGQNRDLYSAGVIAANVNEFVTYYGNSNPDGTGNQIQSVGNKTSNRFGIELGNVWKMSKDLHSPAQRSHGRSIRGGGWNNDINFAESGVRSSAYAGYRFDYVGLALVRSCN